MMSVQKPLRNMVHPAIMSSVRTSPDLGESVPMTVASATMLDLAAFDHRRS